MSAVMEEKTFRGLREVAVLVFFASALFFLIALLTFSNEDPGFTHARSIRDLGNACGLFGAWLADFTLSFFGLCSYLFPIIIFWQGYCFYKEDRQPQEKMLTALPWLGFLSILVSVTALLELYKPRMGIELPRNTGGILGEEISNVALISLGNSGATLFLVVLLIAGITLITNLSWVSLMDAVGKYTVFVCRLLYRHGNNWQQHLAKRPSPVERSQPKRNTSKKSLNLVPSFEKTASTLEISEKTSTSSKRASAKRYKSNGNTLPTLDLLDNREIHVIGYSQSDLEAMSRMVETILADFNVIVQVVAFHPGPVITRFELQPAAGVKVSRIVTLSKDLARALSVTSVRIVEIIPGKTVVGLEIPNREREMVTLRELLVSSNFTKAKSLLTLAMGKDIAGTPMVADLGKMPHVLVAGTTGSGKSVAINTMILSLLYKSTPEQVRLIMIDPKMLELSVYEGIPHLLTPVVTDMKEASNALRWAVGEMERRYKLMSKVGVRNLAGFNQLINEAKERGETIADPLFQVIDPDAEVPVLDNLYSIVIIIDELADMMMIVGKKVEELIARLAQKARAAGIHLVLATQRPSVDVLTGLIKANVPTRISFQVSSRIDSRTILDQGGAETLLGNGDMLFLPSGTSIPIRAHGAFVADQEVHRVVEFLKQIAPPNYLEEITRESADNDNLSNGGDYSFSNAENTSLYDQAVAFVTESRKASISSVQRRFRIGYNRAANLIEEMEKDGIVSIAEANGTRVVLAPPPIKD